jgi:molybdopterin-synthase adenylyltransferase
MPHSAVVTGPIRAELAGHLLRKDRQEDLCFAIWQPSTGATRHTALIGRLILPQGGERHVHGTASFESHYFQRAAREAADVRGGVALLHSHPRGRGWQGLSDIDEATEQRHAKRALALTGLPLVGLTMAGDEELSARFWERVAHGNYEQRACENVRVVGDDPGLTWNDRIVPPPPTTSRQVRTVSAWTEETQQSWSRLRIAIVGTGTVGAIIAETLARMGATNILLIDHDTVEMVNLDRLLHATSRDALLRRAKVDVLARGLRRSATARDLSVQTTDYSVVEPRGLAAALDADVVFSCVDRPWPRQALNYVAYAHLVPVIDVGVRVARTPRGNLRNAIWRAHVAAPGRECLACLGQYQPGHVRLERDGRLEDPEYIAQLPEDSPLRARQNVFAFALGAGSLGMNQFMSTTVAPGGIGNVGALLYQLKLGTLDRERGSCSLHCPYKQATGRGDHAEADFLPAGPHSAAESARADRAAASSTVGIRLGRWADDLAARSGAVLDRVLERWLAET